MNFELKIKSAPLSENIDYMREQLLREAEKGEGAMLRAVDIAAALRQMLEVDKALADRVAA